MRRNLGMLVLTMFFSLLFGQTDVFAQKGNDHSKHQGKTESSEINFPEIEGWEKGEKSTFPAKELGYAVTYEAEDGSRVTIYVYDMGEKSIADGVSDQKVKDQLKNAENEIAKVVEMGYYDSAKKQKSDTIKLGGKNGKVEALRSVYLIVVDDQELTSEIYVFGYKNQFIKFRATREAEETGVINEFVVDFLSAMDKLFAK